MATLRAFWDTSGKKGSSWRSGWAARQRPWSLPWAIASVHVLVAVLAGGLAGCDEGPKGEPPVDPRGLCPTDWRGYPYAPAGTDIVFPRDEGAHYPADLGVTMEWWYTIYHLTTPEGRRFSIMATFFMPQLDIAFRPFNITDVDAGAVWDSSEWGELEAGEEHLDLHWTGENPALPSSTFSTRRYASGELVPFGYEQHLYHADPRTPGRSQSLHLRIDAAKSPYIVGEDGYVTIGDAGESYYYSLTHMKVSGELEINGEVFSVSGIGWLDHQWGPFMLSPLVSSSITYEWMALHLDNGDEYMVSTLFDRENRTHTTEGFGSIGWKRADCTQGITLDHSIVRLAYWQHPESGKYYSHRWRIMEPVTGLDVILEPVIEDQTISFFHTHFYEGRSTITGTQDGVPVTGLAFAELVHHYQSPQIRILAPTEGAHLDAASSLEVSWIVTNPDDGLPLDFTVTAQDATALEEVCGVAMGEAVIDRCTGSVGGLSGPTTIRVRAASIDGLITGQAEVEVTLVP